MILRILGIVDQSDLVKEHLFLEVIANGNLSEYAIADNTYAEGKISNLEKHYYSFPVRSVREGDFIKLYTTTGNNSKTDNKDGTKTHSFYRGLNESVCKKETLHLLKIVATENVSELNKRTDPEYARSNVRSNSSQAARKNDPGNK